MEIWAEAGSCEGDMEYAVRCIETIHAAGADALKVQWLRRDTIFTPDAQRFDDTSGNWMIQRDGYPRLLSYDEWREVYALCNENGIEFIPAVFDLDAVDQAAKFKLAHVKIS